MPENKKKSKKQRLDLLVLEKGLAQSRSRARSLILAGNVLINNMPASKPGTLASTCDNIIVKGNDLPYVGRGGLKLEKALKFFDICVKDYICLDIGASTGGFTDCMLQKGAKKVFAVDVGYGQLAWKLRQDPRVIVVERTNIRYMPLDVIPVPVDIATIDVSFISLKIVVPAVLKFLKKNGGIIALIKPQFEVGKGKTGKGGIIRDHALHQEVISNLTEFFTEQGLRLSPVIPSPIHGAKGNKEFLIFISTS
ncbi:MAG: TlyA family RNA methyltransferase [Desulfosarcina sp.]|nr:TlyA family RNA methyltransferase [Desulfobacterales bacterium]